MSHFAFADNVVVIVVLVAAVAAAAAAVAAADAVAAAAVAVAASCCCCCCRVRFCSDTRYFAFHVSGVVSTLSDPPVKEGRDKGHGGLHVAHADPHRTNGSPLTAAHRRRTVSTVQPRRRTKRPVD